MQSIPDELLSAIFSRVNNPGTNLFDGSQAFLGQLSLANKRLMAVSKDLQTRAKFLLHKYSIFTPTNTAPEQWVSLVNDSIFNHNIAIFIHCQLPFDKVFTEVCVEWATSRGHVNLIKWMVQNAQFIDKSKEKGKRNDFQRGLTPTLKSRALIQSCLTGFEEVAQVLLQANADPHYDNNQAICMAAKYGHLECVKLLHQYGANIHVDEEYPLVFSSRNGHCQIVSFLLENGANVHARRDCALHWASEGGYAEIVQLLLEKGADIHSNQGHSLRWASVHGHAHIVSLLLKNGADVEAMDNYSLRNAVKMRHLEIIKLLIDAGADKTANGDEALKWAAEHGDSEVLSILMNTDKVKP